MNHGRHDLRGRQQPRPRRLPAIDEQHGQSVHGGPEHELGAGAGHGEVIDITLIRDVREYLCFVRDEAARLRAGGASRTKR